MKIENTMKRVYILALWTPNKIASFIDERWFGRNTCHVVLANSSLFCLSNRKFRTLL